jgi:hypothetical protein
MQIVENWALIECRPVRLETAADWVNVEIIVETSQNVPGFPNVIAPSPAVIVLRLKGPIDQQILSGRFEVRARRASPDVIWGDGSTLRPLR